MKTIEETYADIDKILRQSSVAKIGGFRPPEDKMTSWFGGRGFGLPNERLPKHNGKDMFCLLQVKISELPIVPPELKNTAFLTVFLSREEYPFDKPHGEGWEIREYDSLENLVMLPQSDESEMVKDLPIQWKKVTDDAPSWENAWELVDLTPINDADDERFFDEYNHYSGTKFGGFPHCIQHEHDLNGFVFQIGSEEKPKWMWADNGIAYFNKNAKGEWIFACQFY